MISLRLCRNTLIRLMVMLVVISYLAAPHAFCQETEDSQVFIAGFNAYQQKDYTSAVEKMNEVLQKYPDTPLRDMALFWLSRSYFKIGNQQEAARYLSQFSKEYPDNPLRGTVEEELLTLAARYDKGEKLSVGAPAVKQPDRQAAQKARAEKERVAALKAEEDRIALEKAALEKAEQQRIAALKEEEARKASEKAEQERVAALKADEERLEKEKIAEQKSAAEKAEQQRLVQLKAEEEKAALARAEQQRLERETAAGATAAAEAARLAAIKQVVEKTAAEKAEKERVAALKADEERLEKEKIAEQKSAAEKAEQQRLVQLKAEEEKAALAQAEQQRLESEAAAGATAAAEAARLAAIKQVEEKTASEKAEQERVAALKAEEDRIALEKAALEKAEQQRIAALKEEEARKASEKAEQERIAALKADEERRTAAENAEKERRTLAKAEEARLARMAALKAEEERKMAEKAAAEAEAARQAEIKAEEQRLALQRTSEEKVKAEKAALREKAIAQYKSIIDNYPSSDAALAAAAKLRELGIAVALPPKAATVEALPENAQVLRLEVAQFAGLEFNLQADPAAYKVANRVSVPFEIINRGNGNDSFYLESGFPAAFIPNFADVSSPDVAINQTPVIAPGETFKGLLNLVIPATSIDGLRITHPVKAASRFMAEASQSREVNLSASAPLLRAVLKTEKTQPLPGEKVAYRIAVLNVGSTVAQDVTLRINFPPQLDPLDYAAAGFKQEMKSALVFDGLQVNSGESREFSVTFQLKEDSLAGQEISTRAELINNPLKTTAAFVSNMVHVQQQRGILVRSGSERIVVIPGQIITVPFIVTNTGNVHEKFRVVSNVKGAQDAAIYHDTNRDSIRQASEPVISEIGPLAPREEASIVVEIKTPKTSSDGSEGGVLLSFTSEGDASRSASGSVQLVYSRPVLQMSMAGRDGRMKPGEVASFDLTITNKGSNLARVVELQSTWPEQLELVAADPSNSAVSNGNIIWRFKEMGAAEKRTIKVSFRVKPGTGVGTNIQVKNVMTYEDQLGNRY